MGMERRLEACTNLYSAGIFGYIFEITDFGEFERGTWKYRNSILLSWYLVPDQLAPDSHPTPNRPTFPPDLSDIPRHHSILPSLPPFSHHPTHPRPHYINRNLARTGRHNLT